MRRTQFKVRGSSGHDLYKRTSDMETGVSGPWVPCTEEEIAGYEEEHGPLIYVPPPPEEGKKTKKRAKRK